MIKSLHNYFRKERTINKPRKFDPDESGYFFRVQGKKRRHSLSYGEAF